MKLAEIYNLVAVNPNWIKENLRVMTNCGTKYCNVGYVADVLEKRLGCELIIPHEEFEDEDTESTIYKLVDETEVDPGIWWALTYINDYSDTFEENLELCRVFLIEKDVQKVLDALSNKKYFSKLSWLSTVGANIQTILNSQE
jgi:hypothetical protein